MNRPARGGASGFAARRRMLLATMLVACVALLGASAAARGAEPVPAPAQSFLHAGPAAGPAALNQILDSRGRTTLLKGVNVDGIVDYFRDDLRSPYPSDAGAYAAGRCPANDSTVEGVVLCEYDFPQLGSLGYSVIRLNLSWSLLEPAPGKVDKTYLDRIAQVVGWARARGLYVVLDMHQDAWSKYVYTRPGDTCAPPFQAIRGFDGAPLWASDHATPACALNGVRELDSAVQEQFQKLYDDLPGPDGKGLQEHYADVMVALARRFRDEPAVAGYEIINEPSPGFNAVPGAVDAAELFPFYGKVVNTVVARVPRFRQLFFIEPNAERDVTDQSAIVTPWSAYSSYPNVIYAPHVYTGVFTLDQQVASRRFLPSDGGYRSAISDAHALGLPLWIGEFGNNPGDDETLLRKSYELQDTFALGGALWLWKENANDVNRAVFWGVYGPPFPPGTPQPARIKLTSRPYPLYTAGELESVTYDPDSGAFSMRARSQAISLGSSDRATVLVLPPSFGADIGTSNAGLRVRDLAGGGRIAYVYPRGGTYRVFSG